jgi:hypothetical protein
VPVHIFEAMILTSRDKNAYLRHKGSALVGLFIDMISYFEYVMGVFEKKTCYSNIYSSNSFVGKSDWDEEYCCLSEVVRHVRMAETINAFCNDKGIERLIALIAWEK